MKICMAEREVERFSSGAENVCQIEATAKAFKILSSGLYKDKIKAIIREISCNAYDAHVEAGCADKPFLVILPTGLDPHFVVRDYGTGLSHEDIISTYSTFFKSNKTHTNALIGGLGLGSKSPWSYVDSFTVTSWFGGMKRIYSAYINEVRRPCVTLMGEFPSDEPQGLEVKVSVARMSDFAYFATKAKEVYEFFNVKPIIEGVPELEFPAKEIILEGTGWRVYKIPPAGSYGYIHQKDPIAIMGNVPYPIDRNVLNGFSHAESLIYSIGNLEIIFPIGSLEVAPSREELDYDPATLEALRTRSLEIREELLAKARSVVSSAPSEREARKAYQNFLQTNNLEQVIKTFAVDSFCWRRKKISTGMFEVDMRKCSGAWCEILSSNSKSRGVFSVNRSRYTLLIGCNKNIPIVIDDMKIGTKSRVKELRKTIDEVLLVGGSAYGIKRFLAQLRGYEVILASTLPKYQSPPRQKIAPKGVLKLSHPVTFGETFSRVFGQNDEDIDPYKDGFYILNEKNSIQGFSGKNECVDCIRLAISLGILDKDAEIYYLPKSFANKLPEDHNLLRLDTYLTDIVLAKLQESEWKNILRAGYWSLNLSYCQHLNNSETSRFLQNFNVYYQNETLIKLVERLNYNKSMIDKARNITEVANCLGVALSPEKDDYLEELYNDLLQNYPLFLTYTKIASSGYIRYSHAQDDVIAQLVDYIKAKDQLRNKGI